jgi:protein-tyrosine phosphatase
MHNVFWIKGDPPSTLAVVLCPRGSNRLEDELLRIRREGVQILVSLLEEREAVMLGLAEEGSLARRSGMKFLSYPIPDVHVPQDPHSFRLLAEELAIYLRDGRCVGVHCRGSIGRATVTAACALIHLGWEPKVALAAIEAARGCPIPDTEEQRQWILDYKAQP